jgi:DNA-binding FrmR family transcriptional regulator
VLTQLLAVSHALNGAGFMILTDGLRHSAATQPVGADQAATVARLEKLFLSLA